jgi:hypothetical protein
MDLLDTTNLADEEIMDMASSRHFSGNPVSGAGVPIFQAASTFAGLAAARQNLWRSKACPEYWRIFP